MEHRGRRTLLDSALRRRLAQPQHNSSRLNAAQRPLRADGVLREKPVFWERARLPCAYLRSGEGRSAAVAPGTRWRRRLGIVPMV